MLIMYLELLYGSHMFDLNMHVQLCPTVHRIITSKSIQLVCQIAWFYHLDANAMNDLGTGVGGTQALPGF